MTDSAEKDVKSMISLGTSVCLICGALYTIVRSSPGLLDPVTKKLKFRQLFNHICSKWFECLIILYGIIHICLNYCINYKHPNIGIASLLILMTVEVAIYGLLIKIGYRSRDIQETEDESSDEEVTKNDTDRPKISINPISKTEFMIEQELLIRDKKETEKESSNE